MGSTLVEPNAHTSPVHRRRLEQMLTAELDRLLADLPHTSGVTTAHLVGESPDMPAHPGVYAAYHRLRRGALTSYDTVADELTRLARDAAAYRERRPHGLARMGDADYADGCLRRALAQKPADIDRSTVTSHLIDWSDEQRDLLDQAVTLLSQVWPEAHDEIQTVVAEVCLLGGHGLVGFTDFFAHGAIFISDVQLTAREGVGQQHLLAESVLHEATHTVCNAAGISEPMVRRPRNTEGPHESPLVQTPLRADPRPLAGLAQQLVVLTRCSEFYRRAAGSPLDDGRALERRARSLSDKATAAAVTLRKFEGHLTDTGVRTIDEALERI